VLWPWPNGLEGTELGAPGGSVPAAIALALVGLALVFGVNEVALRIEGRTRANEVDEVRAS
jgi:hypothetical protein